MAEENGRCQRCGKAAIPKLGGDGWHPHCAVCVIILLAESYEKSGPCKRCGKPAMPGPVGHPKDYCMACMIVVTLKKVLER